MCIKIEKENKSKLKHETRFLLLLVRTCTFQFELDSTTQQTPTCSTPSKAKTHTHTFLSNQVLSVKLVIRVVLELQKSIDRKIVSQEKSMRSISIETNSSEMFDRNIFGKKSGSLRVSTKETRFLKTNGKSFICSPFVYYVSFHFDFDNSRKMEEKIVTLKTFFLTNV